MVMSLSSAFSEILTSALEWDGHKNYKAEVGINYDFYDENISSEELVKYMRAWQSGGLSFDAYYHLLESKEVYPKDWNMKKERDKIQENLENYLDLPEERYLEVTERMNKLSEMLKLTESAALAGMMAEVVPEGSLRKKQDLQIELDLVEEETSDDEPIVPEPTFDE